MARAFPSLSSKIETLPSDIPDRMVEYAFVLRELGECRRVLDVGCTSPYNIIPLILADRGIEVHGIDIREFKINHPSFKFHRRDIRKTDFPDSYFDVIIAVSTVEHIGLRGRYSSQMDPDGSRKAILEIYRILRGGGYLFLTIPFGRAKVVGSSHRIYDTSGLRRLVQGFNIVKCEFYCKDPGGYWRLSTEEYATTIDAPPAKESAVACLKLSKP